MNKTYIFNSEGDRPPDYEVVDLLSLKAWAAFLEEML